MKVAMRPNRLHNDSGTESNLFSVVMSLGADETPGTHSHEVIFHSTTPVLLSGGSCGLKPLDQQSRYKRHVSPTCWPITRRLVSIECPRSAESLQRGLLTKENPVEKNRLVAALCLPSYPTVRGSV